jgi:hypothetical protein
MYSFTSWLLRRCLMPPRSSSSSLVAFLWHLRKHYYLWPTIVTSTIARYTTALCGRRRSVEYAGVRAITFLHHIATRNITFWPQPLLTHNTHALRTIITSAHWVWKRTPADRKMRSTDCRRITVDGAPMPSLARRVSVRRDLTKFAI